MNTRIHRQPTCRPHGVRRVPGGHGRSRYAGHQNRLSPGRLVPGSGFVTSVRPPHRAKKCTGAGIRLHQPPVIRSAQTGTAAGNTDQRRSTLTEDTTSAVCRRCGSAQVSRRGAETRRVSAVPLRLCASARHNGRPRSVCGRPWSTRQTCRELPCRSIPRYNLRC